MALYSASQLFSPKLYRKEPETTRLLFCLPGTAGEEAVCHCALAQHSPEEEETGATPSSPAFPCGIPTWGQALFTACEAHPLSCLAFHSSVPDSACHDHCSSGPRHTSLYLVSISNPRICQLLLGRTWSALVGTCSQGSRVWMSEENKDPLFVCVLSTVT